MFWSIPPLPAATARQVPDAAQEDAGYAVISNLSRIEATASLLLVGQMAQTQGPQWIDKDKLDEPAKAADKFISKQSLERGVAVVKYIYRETPPETASNDRRRKWTDWEI